MKRQSRYIGQRVLWVLMALHILNFSIDNPHTFFEHSTVDEDFEEVDSMAELVLEDVLLIENAIPEHHTKSTQHLKLNVKKTVWTFEAIQGLKVASEGEENFKQVQPDTFYKDPLYNTPKLTLFSPPPEV
ncbi:hypothetical protein ACLI1A_09620 [Flavobacterium sp. RHBU_3]|uniref:hypothetical protein n=1 Tax=Flavobacterium sp. RHBU_3 TaxID=3391184 RepID=UPI003984A202